MGNYIKKTKKQIKKLFDDKKLADKAQKRGLSEDDCKSVEDEVVSKNKNEVFDSCSEPCSGADCDFVEAPVDGEVIRNCQENPVCLHRG